MAQNRKLFQSMEMSNTSKIRMCDGKIENLKA